MSTELQARAKAFLSRPVPKDLGYAADSIAERFIATYAKKGKLPDDPEAGELLELAVMESTSVVEQLGAGSAGDYLRESVAILEAIQAEL